LWVLRRGLRARSVSRAQWHWTSRARLFFSSTPSADEHRSRPRRTKVDAPDDDANARIVLGNLAQPELRDAVVEALLEPLRVAMNKRLPSTTPLLRRRWASDTEPYQASKKNKQILEAPERSVLCRAVLDNKDELRVATLIDHSSDVVGWIYNHAKVAIGSSTSGTVGSRSTFRTSWFERRSARSSTV
jgi:hypothetical protein